MLCLWRWFVAKHLPTKCVSAQEKRTKRSRPLRLPRRGRRSCCSPKCSLSCSLRPRYSERRQTCSLTVPLNVPHLFPKCSFLCTLSPTATKTNLFLNCSPTCSPSVPQLLVPMYSKSYSNEDEAVPIFRSQFSFPFWIHMYEGERWGLPCSSAFPPYARCSHVTILKAR